MLSKTCLLFNMAKNSKVTEYDKDQFIQQGVKYYEVTINPNDKYQYFGKGDSRLSVWVREVDERIQEDLRDQDYVLYTDMSFPHINVNAKKDNLPRLHLHGTITFKTKTLMAKFWLTQMYNLSRWANVTVNVMREDAKEWDTYCKKSMPILSSVIDKKFLIFSRKRPRKKPLKRGIEAYF